jgi:hypothetical protein
VSGKEGGRTADLKGAKVTVTGYVNGESRTQLELLEGFRRIPFGLSAPTLPFCPLRKALSCPDSGNAYLHDP